MSSYSSNHRSVLITEVPQRAAGIRHATRGVELLQGRLIFNIIIITNFYLPSLLQPRRCTTSEKPLPSSPLPSSPLLSSPLLQGVPRSTETVTALSLTALCSQFVHGCAVLLPEELQALPYWIGPCSCPCSFYVKSTG